MSVPRRRGALIIVGSYLKNIAFTGYRNKEAVSIWAVICSHGVTQYPKKNRKTKAELQKL